MSQIVGLTPGNLSQESPYTTKNHTGKKPLLAGRKLQSWTK